MTSIVIDESLTKQLRDVHEPCVLLDSAGNKLGFFRPEIDRSLYEGLEPSVSDEELDRRSREGGGRTLAEIMADLKG
jgi:hypothetical protein